MRATATRILLCCSACFVCQSLVAQERTAVRKVTRSYDIRAVTDAPADSGFLLGPQGELVFQPRGAEARADVPTFGDERLLKPKPDAKQVTFDDEEVEATDWAEVRAEEVIVLLARELGLPEGGEPEGVRYHDGRLFVHATPDVHEKIGRFIAELRRQVRSGSVRVECLLVPPEVLERLKPGWRAAAPAIDDEVFALALLDKRSRLVSAVARNGQIVTAGSTEIDALLAKHDINQTGVIPVSETVVEAPLAGDRLQVRPFRLPGEEAVLLDLAVGRFQVTSGKSTPSALWSDLDLAVTAETLLSTTTVIQAGKTYVAGSLGGEEGSVALVRVHLRGETTAAPPGRTGNRYRRSYNVSPLLRASPHRAWWDHDSDTGQWVSTDELIELIMMATGGEEFWDDDANEIESSPGQLHVWASREAHRAIDQLLEEEIHRHTRVVALDLEVLEARRDLAARIQAQAEDAFLLAEDWRKILEGVESVKRSRYTLTGVNGERHALRLAKLGTLVTGVDNVSGGTGFAIVEMPRPVVSTCGEGAEFRMQVDLATHGDLARLHLQGVEATILEIKSVKARYPSITETLTSKSDRAGQTSVSAPRFVVNEVQLSLPRQKVVYWQLDRELPLDRDVILESSAEGEGARLLVARVRKIR